MKTPDLDMTAKEMKYLLGFASKDITRYNLCSMAFWGNEILGERVTIACAVDGHKLVLRIPRGKLTEKDVPHAANLALTGSGPTHLLPREPLDSMAKGTKPTERILVQFDEENEEKSRAHVLVNQSGLRRATAPLEGLFPDISQVIPTPHGYSLEPGKAGSPENEAVPHAYTWAVNADYLSEIGKIGKVLGKKEFPLRIISPSDAFAPMAFSAWGEEALYLITLMPMRL